MSSLIYDKTGNLIGDVSESITRVNWTVYGKIANITKSGNTMHYGYDAGGNRITKKVSATKEDYYVRDAQGNVLALYAYDNGSLTWAEQHVYGSSRLGMVTPGVTIEDTAPLANDSYNPTGDPITNGIEGKRIYELTNHLGNVLVTISDIKTGVDDDSDTVIDYYIADVLTAQDYYAFGMLMPGRTYRKLGAEYKYGFNGKENDDEVKGEGNQQDYGMRIYDPRLGRFLSVDPLTRDYPYYTPYQFSGNKPIKFIDLDGLEEFDPQEWLRNTSTKLTNSYSERIEEANKNKNVFERLAANYRKNDVFNDLYRLFPNPLSTTNATRYLEGKGGYDIYSISKMPGVVNSKAQQRLDRMNNERIKTIIESESEAGTFTFSFDNGLTKTQGADIIWSDAAQAFGSYQILSRTIINAKKSEDGTYEYSGTTTYTFRDQYRWHDGRTEDGSVLGEFGANHKFWNEMKKYGAKNFHIRSYYQSSLSGNQNSQNISSKVDSFNTTNFRDDSNSYYGMPTDTPLVNDYRKK